jgi:hypothetical protein
MAPVPAPSAPPTKAPVPAFVAQPANRRATATTTIVGKANLNRFIVLSPFSLVHCVCGGLYDQERHRQLVRRSHERFSTLLSTSSAIFICISIP